MIIGFLLQQKGVSKTNDRNRIILTEQEEGTYIIDILRFYSQRFDPESDEVRLDNQGTRKQ